MKDSGFKIGDKVFLKPIDEIKKIREYYTEQGYFKKEYNERFYNDLITVSRNEEYEISNIRLYSDAAHIYEIFVKDLEFVTSSWVLTQEYFIHAYSEELVDNNIPSIFGMMDG